MSTGDPFQLAIEHQRAGRLAEAEATCRSLLARNSNDLRAAHMLGVLLLQQRRPAEAAPLLQRAAAATTNPDVQFVAGEASRLSGQFAAAEAAYRKSLSARALFPPAHNALGLALVQQGKVESAILAWQRAIQLKPDFAEALANLGAALAQQKKFSEAATVLRKAVQLNPKFAPAHNNLANVLNELEETDAAMAEWRAAIELAPNYFDALTNLGRALQIRGEPAAALEFLDRAVALKPDDPDARFLRGLSLLVRGDLAAGFADYAYRLKCTGFDVHGRRFAQGEWDGGDVAFKTFLIHTEQGLGDTIQFIRYAPLLAERGARVIVECPPDLTDLLRTVRGVDDVIPRPNPLPAFDVHAGVLDLPRLFGTTLDTIPANVPYVSANESRIAAWRDVLASDPPGKRVGLVWSGNPKHTNDRNRSIPLREFEPLADLPNLNFFSLQKGPAAGQMSDSTLRLRLIDHTARLHDFADTAAMISLLDVVITVDTSVAHLAGAMGKPTWVLLPKVPDWRWMLDRADSPWYPTVRLMRQRQAGEWAGVIDAVASALQSI
jgi:tetratricopeptide (TPR) repeat protein